MSTYVRRESGKAAQRKKLNDGLRGEADHNGEPWADHEIAIALDPTRTAAEAAAILGRTFHAVGSIRREYRSPREVDPT